MKKNRKRIDPRYFLEETAIRDDLDDTLTPLSEVVEDSDLGDVLAPPGLNKKMDQLRRTAGLGRGKVQDSGQSEPEAEAEEDLSIEDLAEDLSIEDLAEDIRDMIEGKINDIIDDAELHNYLMEVIELLREDTYTLGQK